MSVHISHVLILLAGGFFRQFGDLVVGVVQHVDGNVVILYREGEVRREAPAHGAQDVVVGVGVGHGGFRPLQGDGDADLRQALLKNLGVLFMIGPADDRHDPEVEAVRSSRSRASCRERV